MTSTIEATVYYDYMCPYAFRVVKLFSEMEQTRDDLAVTWRFFSLEQSNAVARGQSADWQIWEQPLDYESVFGRPHRRILAPFLATVAAMRQGSAAASRFRLAVFRAYHDEKQNIADPAVLLELARQAELDLAQFTTCWQSPEARAHLRADHVSGLELGVFGTPTISINGCEATYLRLSALAENPQERQTCFEELVRTFTLRPFVQEFKRASAA